MTPESELVMLQRVNAKQGIKASISSVDLVVGKTYFKTVKYSTYQISKYQIYELRNNITKQTSFYIIHN